MNDVRWYHLLSIWYRSRDSIQRRIDKNIRTKIEHNNIYDISSTHAYTRLSSISVDAYAYSLDLFTTSLSLITALLLFQETFRPFILFLLFSFGIIDPKSLLPKRFSISEITRFHFEKLLHHLVFNFSASYIFPRHQISTKLYK